MKGSPILSVLMTCYNRQACIAEAIESVLQSSFKDFELIIVDDASTDDSVSIARAYATKDTRIKLFVNEQNLGDYPNRNRAASYATGRYIKYVDSDDKVYPQSLATMVTGMEQYPTAGLGFCDKPENNKTNCSFFTGAQALEKHFFGGGFLQAGPSTAILSKAAFDAMGGFSCKRYVSDYEAWLNLCLREDVVLLPSNLVWIRIHSGQENEVGRLEYYHLNYRIHKNFVESDACPFKAGAKKKLLFNYKVLLARRIFQRIIKWYGFKAALQTLHKAGLGPLTLLMAPLPMKKLKHV